jgi:hypothetical protein
MPALVVYASKRVEVRQVYVAPDGPWLARLGELLAAGTIGATVSAHFRWTCGTRTRLPPAGHKWPGSDTAAGPGRS